VRLRKQHGGLSVNAVAGTHVVFFGLDLAASKRAGCRGFGFKRFDHAEGDTIWLHGLKTFEKTEPHPAAGESFSTLRQPIQGFQWADYSAKPGTTYTYTVVALYGDPADLKQRITVEIEITTESEVGAVHSAFFNRGSVATQEYARRFQNRPPNIAGPGAYEWLSRGLLEAFVAFLGRAGPGWEVHGACYEFQWPDALAAVRQAHQRGAKVHVLFDDMGPSKANRAAIKAAKIRALCRGRVHGKLMHNKFFVLSRNGAPQAVWTGSTNLTENGIFGHANVGHVVEDVTIAQAFRDYWDRLAADSPVAAPYRSANEQASPAPPHPWKSVTTAVFSPRGAELDALQWYADIAGSAKQGLFMTFAFGMNQKFMDVYRRDDDVLRMALMEKEWGNPRTRAQETQAIQQIRKSPQRRRRGRQPHRHEQLRPLARRDVAHRSGRPRLLGAHEVHARRPARRAADGRHRQRELQQGEHGHERREHARHPRRQARRRHLLRGIPAAVHALRVPRVGEDLHGEEAAGDARGLEAAVPRGRRLLDGSVLRHPRPRWAGDQAEVLRRADVGRR